MRIGALIAGVLLLAGCGVDGPPQPPAAPTAPGGVTASGELRIGVTGGTR